MNIHRLLTGFGWSSLTLAALALVATPLGIHPQGLALDGYLFTLGLMMLVSAGVIVAGRLRARQDPLAEKAVPSSLVAYLLFLLIALRWLSD